MHIAGRAQGLALWACVAHWLVIHVRQHNLCHMRNMSAVRSFGHNICFSTCTRCTCSCIITNMHTLSFLRNGLGLLGCPPYQVTQSHSGSRVNSAASVKTVTISINGGLRSALHLPLVLPARGLMHEGLPRHSSVHPARVAAGALASLALHSCWCGVYAVRIQFVVRVWPRNDLRCSAVNRETF